MRVSHPVRFQGMTHEYGPPVGLDEMVGRLPFFSNGVSNVSCWQLSPGELQEVIDSGGKVFVSVMSGCGSTENPLVFPMYASSESNCKLVVSDTGGVW